MQPARLGAALGCLIASGLLVSMPLAPSCRAQGGSAQPVLETPQQVNNRIRELSSGLRMKPHDYVIGPGDVLDIEVFDVKELSREVRVSQTGTIGIPLVPVRLRVAGLTELQAEQKIAEVLESNGLVTHADVSVSVKDHKSKPITVVGAVPHPMVYEADRQVTLLEVLAAAGGVANDAGDTVIVTRPVPDPSADEVAPPEADAEPAAAAPAGNSTVAKGSASSGPSPAMVASAPSNSSSQAEPPPLANTITVNLNDLMETGDTKNN